MVPPTPTPSGRLVRAAAAEREDLRRHRERLLETRESLRVELARIESSLQEVDERDALLDRLTGPAEPRAATTAVPPAPADAGASTTLLRGPAIRRAAVEAMLRHPERPEALHYRDWFEALRQAGFAVAGKESAGRLPHPAQSLSGGAQEQPERRLRTRSIGARTAAPTARPPPRRATRVDRHPERDRGPRSHPSPPRRADDSDRSRREGTRGGRERARPAGHRESPRRYRLRTARANPAAALAQPPSASITSLEWVTGRRLPSSSMREPEASSISSSTRTFTR